MIVYHVTTVKKLHKYLASGYIQPPVRAWLTAEAAERFSIQTGRRVILRLKFNNSKAKLLLGHKNQAVFLEESLPVKGW